MNGSFAITITVMNHRINYRKMAMTAFSSSYFHTLIVPRMKILMGKIVIEEEKTDE